MPLISSDLLDSLSSVDTYSSLAFSASRHTDTRARDYVIYLFFALTRRRIQMKRLYLIIEIYYRKIKKILKIFAAFFLFLTLLKKKLNKLRNS